MTETERIDTERLMELISVATNSSGWTDELGEDGSDSIFYDDDPVRQWERRVRESEVAALAAIAFLLLRHDELMWKAWERY